MQLIEFVDNTTRTTSGGLKIGIHGIKLGKFRIDLPGWAGTFASLVSSGQKPGEAALSATAEGIARDPGALNAALFGQGNDPSKFWNQLGTILQSLQANGQLTPSSANEAVATANENSRSTTGPLLLIAGIGAIVMLLGGFDGRTFGRRSRGAVRSAGRSFSRFGHRRSSRKRYAPRRRTYRAARGSYRRGRR